jgi:phenylacetate-coenzyme A ligase PaaK-like adenylate-forming protein
MALLYQMELSQWWTPRQLLRHEMRQLVPLMQHAFANVPYYRGHRRAGELMRNGISRRNPIPPACQF